MVEQKILVITVRENPPDYNVLLQRDVEYSCDKKWLAAMGERERAADLVILDCACETSHCVDLLKEIKQCRPDLPVVFVTDASCEDTVTKAFKRGARDYFRTPVDEDEFRKTVDSILQHKRYASGHWHTSLALLPENVVEILRPPAGIPESLVRAIRFIERNLSRPITLDKIAWQAFMSKYHFCRLFKQNMGVSPMQFVIHSRIKMAMTLLRRKDLPISVVAIQSGFNDLSEFNRQFRKITSWSPSEYRKSM